MEADVHAASGNNVKHVVFVAGSQEECGKINSDSILYGILERVQQFIANKATVKLWIVTRGSHNISVDGGEAVVPWQTALWRLGKAIAIEYPAVQYTMVDLDVTCSIASQLEALRSEIASNTHEAISLGTSFRCGQDGMPTVRL
jgi:hypothetical protein